MAEEFAGWIVLFKGEKLEIGKDEAAGIYEAKKIAIAHFKPFKKDLFKLVIAPAYED